MCDIARERGLSVCETYIYRLAYEERNSEVSQLRCGLTESKNSLQYDECVNGNVVSSAIWDWED